MRTLALLCLSGLSAQGFAQQPVNANEQLIWQAYSQLEQQPSFSLSMAGTSKVGNSTRSFSSTLYWQTGTDPAKGQPSLAQVEMDDYDTTGQSPVLLRRYVGDGKTLWFYDFTTRTYSASFYSYFGKTQPANYPGTDAPRLLGQLYSETRGPSSYLVRLMREINPGSDTLVPNYETWAPGYTNGIPPTTPPAEDPLVPSRSYSTLGNETWVLYPAPTPPPINPTRSVAFQLDNVSPNDAIPKWELSAIYFADVAPSRTNPWRAVNWSIQVSETPTPPVGSFKAYNSSVISGWQAIEGPRAFTG